MPWFSWFWPIVYVIGLIWFLERLLSLTKKKKKHPPGPIGLPIIGHFHLLQGKNPHRDLHRLARKHGPIMHLRFGFVPTIVVTSPAAAKLVLKTHDLAFFGRPLHEASKHLAYDGRDIAFGQYGSYWRDMRKLCTVNLLSNLKISQFQPMRKAELRLLVDRLRRASESREIVDVSEMITALSGDMICLMVFGRKYAGTDFDENEFKSVIEETMRVVVVPNLGDYFPCIAALDLQGLTRRMKELHKTFDGFFERIIDDHVRNKQEKKEARDFVDTMMAIMESGEAGFEFDRRHVKAILIPNGGTDTSAVTVNWALAELIRHPQIMKKLQQERERVVGINEYVEESHLDKLEYLDLVLKETFRLHPTTVLLNHEAMQDCTVNEFHISKGSQILVNVWSISRDPNVWQDPEKFSPERFIGSSVDFRGHHYELIPFGSGRRACPGLQLGLTTVRLVVAQLVHCFDWELPTECCLVSWTWPSILALRPLEKSISPPFLFTGYLID